MAGGRSYMFLSWGVGGALTRPTLLGSAALHETIGNLPCPCGDLAFVEP